MNFAKFPRTSFHRTPLNNCFSTMQHFLAENPSKVLNGQQQHNGVTFHWSRISLPLVKLSFTTIIFYYVGQKPPEACSGDLPTWSRASWKCKIFHIAKFYFFCFGFEKMSSSIPIFVVMLLALVGKRSNSRSQMFSKAGVLKNFAIFAGKNLCWSFFLIEFQDWRPTFLFKKRLERRCFSVNIAKFLRAAFLLKTCTLNLFKIFIWW